MLHADLLKAAERGEELLGGAHEAVLFLGHGLAGDLDRQTAGETDRVRIALGLHGPAPDVVEAGRQLARRDPHEVGEPRITVGPGSPLRASALAADPDGNARLLQRLGRKSHLVEVVVASVESRLLVVPEPMDDLELLVGHRPALLEGDPERVELLHHPADPDPEDQATFREVVDRRGDLGPGERMAIGHDQHAHPERDLFGAAGEEREARERLEEGNVGRNDEALVGAVRVPGVDLPGGHDAVRRPDGVVPKSLRPPRRIRQDRARRSA